MSVSTPLYPDAVYNLIAQFNTLAQYKYIRGWFSSELDESDPEDADILIRLDIAEKAIEQLIDLAPGPFKNTSAQAIFINRHTYVSCDTFFDSLCKRIQTEIDKGIYSANKVKTFNQCATTFRELKEALSGTFHD